ncbi:MAG TPA: DUF169 domain-containing protein [Syntrophorhabdaceae bacterium]|nr:DUF169 domain-containing protein [Syntrophorhabdaceae bacterium]HOL06204.1 DUF169 domain-containing protein [Syntrophorhabdaceae bacterium]
MEEDDMLARIRKAGEDMIRILGLATSPVGVRFLKQEDAYPEGAEVLEQHRYCQALMKARHGGNVILDGDGISCPAAASAFGIKSLPSGLKSGKGLVGFGIVSEEAVGKRMFELMPRLKDNEIKAIHLFPLESAGHIPDVVVVEDEIEKLMWIGLAYLHATGGERILSTTAILQATCVDTTIIPYTEQRLNMSYGCYGCRDATDIGSNETVLGFPVSVLDKIIAHLHFLAQKAIPASRGKNALSALEGREKKNTDCSSEEV